LQGDTEYLTNGTTYRIVTMKILIGTYIHALLEGVVSNDLAYP